MKAGIVILAAALALCAAPAAGQGLAAGEIALHINAQAYVPPDYATFDIDLSAEGATRADAEAALHEIEKASRAELAEFGVGAADVEITSPEFAEGEEIDWDAAAEAAAAAAVDAVEDEYGLAEEIDEAELPRVPHWTATSRMTVRIADVAKLAQAGALAGEAFDFRTPRMKFHFVDEDKAAREAIAAALANARREADAHAAAMGYRVVRIVAVSNDGPPLSLPTLISTIATLDNPRNLPFQGHKLATVSVDYAIAPN